MNPESKLLLRNIVNTISMFLSIAAIICIPFTSRHFMTWVIWLQVVNILVLGSVRYYTNPNR